MDDTLNTVRYIWLPIGLALILKAGPARPRPPVPPLDRAGAELQSAFAAAGVRISGSRDAQGRITLSSQDVLIDRPLRFGPEASGRPGAPIIVRAAPGAQVRFIGSAPLGAPLLGLSKLALQLLPAAARGHVLAYHLDSETERQFLAEHNTASGEAVMLTQGGVKLSWARWPEAGYVQAPALPGPDRTPIFPAPQRAGMWAGEPALRAGGYWSYDWAYETTSLTLDAGTLRGRQLSAPYPIAKRYRYFVYNAVSELRRPGQFVVLPATHEILVWPRQSEAAGPLRLVRAQHLLEVEGAHDVRFEGLQFLDSLDTSVAVTTASRVVFADDLVANAGGVGIAVSGGQDDSIERSVVADTGSSGIVLTGGDRATLVGGGHRVVNSVIVRTGQHLRTNHAAVLLKGVGLTIRGNLIRYAPHQAIGFYGNDHRIADNEISDVVTETGDAGAIYAGRDPSARGTVIEHNFLHDIYPRMGQPEDVRGIYLDDFISGITVRRNLFYNVRNAVYLNGGSDNIIIENIFANVIGNPVTARNASGQWIPEYGDILANGRDAIANAALYQSRYPEYRVPTQQAPPSPTNSISRNHVLRIPTARRRMALEEVFARSRDPSLFGYNAATPDQESALSGLRFFANARVDFNGDVP